MIDTTTVTKKLKVGSTNPDKLRLEIEQHARANFSGQSLRNYVVTQTKGLRVTVEFIFAATSTTASAPA